MRWLPLIKQWWHCLLGIFGKHQRIYLYHRSKLTSIECQCGRIFWEDKDMLDFNAYLRDYSEEV